MVLFNRTAEHLKKREWDKALEMYQKAAVFEHDTELQQMISLSELLTHQKGKSQERAKRALASLPKERLEPDLLLVDLSLGTLSEEGASAILEFSDADGDELLAAIASLQELLKSCPESRVLHLHLAHALLGYGKTKEALPVLERLCGFNDAPCSTHTLLAFLYHERMSFPQAWAEGRKAVAAAKKQQFLPRPLRKFILDLHHESPNCVDIADMI